MPVSATREALSRSMADLNFDLDPKPRRARANRSKKDLSQSCSAFHFVLDPSELGQAGADATIKKAKSTGSKPSYSDLVMDATSKQAAADFPQLSSPTSVLTEETEESALAEQAASPNTGSQDPGKSSNNRPTRSIPSSSEFNRARNRNFKSKSNHEGSGVPPVADPSTPNTRARRNRKIRSNSGKFSKSCHMSMMDTFPEPSEFLATTTTTTTSIPTTETAKATRTPRSNAQERFSKSFSGGFGNWDPSELTSTPTRRRGKKPITTYRSKSDDAATSTGFSQEFSLDFSSDKTPTEDPFSSPFDNSFSEMDLLSETLDKKSPSPSSPPGEEKQEVERFSLSFSDIAGTDLLEDKPSNKNGRRRRSIDGLGVTMNVERQKVSVEEFNEAFPTQLRTARSKKDSSTDKRGAIRPNSGVRPRRSSSSDSPIPIGMAKSSREGGRRARAASPHHGPRTPSVGAAKRTPSVGAAKRSASREGKISRRRASMDYKSKATEPPTGSPSQAARRGLRRAKSGDGTTRLIKERQASTGTGRKPGSRRTKSSDGTSPNYGRRAHRSTSMGFGPKAEDKNLHKSFSVLSSESARLPSRPLSGGDRTASRGDRAIRSKSGEGAVDEPTPSPRRKMPPRSKSHDGTTMTAPKRISRDKENSTKDLRVSARHRQNSAKEVRMSATRERENASKELRSSATRERGDKGQRGSSRSRDGAAMTKANRRAMAHNILNE